jgi:3-oxoacyl-[acyl-carrier protein] reductase
MEATAAERVARLASHLSAAPAPALARAPAAVAAAPPPPPLARAPTAASSAPPPPPAEPGRLLAGQIALITGAGAGIGRAAALLFAAHGARVAAADLDAAAADATAAAVNAASPASAIAIAGDVTADGFAERALAETAAAFGTPDLLVLNAGYTWDGLIHKMSDAQWAAMLDVHATAPFRLLRAFGPALRAAATAEAAGGGAPRPRAVLTVSSVSGTHGNSGQANYAAAKAAVVGLTKSVAREWGRYGVRANCVAFGHVQTRLTGDKAAGAAIAIGGERVALGIPGGGAVAAFMAARSPLGRTGTPEEAAGALLLLASPHASFITGQVLEVDGGAFL